MNLFRRAPRRRPAPPRVRPAVEALESRVVPYATSGSSWAHPQLITISFVPDGTVVGASGNSYIKSNLFSVFNNRFGSTAKWQNAILQGAQVWAQQANVNFTVVSDDGSTIGSGPDQQGDPNKGDIRISGYNFGSSTLATTDLPPQVNNYSVGGDLQLNTGAAFNVGTTYDLETVASHEIGHALGLDHSNVYQAEMYPNYTGVKSSLNADDVQGIQAVYGARRPDAYDAGGSNGSFATASDITSAINTTSQTAVVNNLDITTPSDQDYYTFTAPAKTSGNLTVTVQSQGLSLLAPTLTVYGANQAQLGTVSGAGKYGTTLTLTLGNVTAGQRFYMKVAGTDGSALGTGAYALTLNFGTGPNPTVSSPNTTTPNGNPLSAGGGLAENNGGLLGGLLPGVLGFLLGLVKKETLSADAAADAAARTAVTTAGTPSPAASASGGAVAPSHGGVLSRLLPQAPAILPTLLVPTVAPVAAVAAPAVGPINLSAGGTTAAAVAAPAAPSRADATGLVGGVIEQPGAPAEDDVVAPTAAPSGPPPAAEGSTAAEPVDVTPTLDTQVRDACFEEGFTLAAPAEALPAADGADAPALPAGAAVVAVLGAWAVPPSVRRTEAEERSSRAAKQATRA